MWISILIFFFVAKKKEMIQTDILIIGAGPVGLFTVFEAGLLKMRCHLVDSLGQPGGQLTEIYPKKPIYDIPGYPSVLAGELVERLMAQIAPFNPGYTLGERAEQIERLNNGHFRLTTNKGSVLQAPVIAIAAGLGAFEPRKPPLENLEHFEGRGVEYVIRDPEFYRGKRVVIAGGGDSALDWSIYLAELAREVTLIHRRREFRGAPDSVEKILGLAQSGRVQLVTDANVIALEGSDHLSGIVIEQTGTGLRTQPADHFIPLFGLSPKLGPIAEWGLQIEKNAVEVDTFDYSTCEPGIYAIGDINTYPGKLKLILCGFHEATLMCQSAFKRVFPEKKISFKYTTVNGVEGF